MSETKLTEFSHGSGCGCKLAPAQLQEVLSHVSKDGNWPELLVGNDAMDDAAVIKSGDQAIISTTDFFMPIVDDASDFGSIAAVNAINDVYAMGGKPIMALAILGWPIEKLGAKIAGSVVEGARKVCADAGIPLAGGHSIDSKEPIFGLAVTGVVDADKIITNAGAQDGDLLYLTKPLGVGIVSTAQKRKLAEESHVAHVTALMKQPNAIGEQLATMSGIHAMTDVTGFGLIGHLLEVCKGSGVSAQINFDAVPTLPDEMLEPYLAQFVMPDNTMRNFSAYSEFCSQMSAKQLQILCDPQTSGGLLISVDPNQKDVLEVLLNEAGLNWGLVGHIAPGGKEPMIEIV
jgi:selenide,water dikinase